jgi:hypothetical protein
MPHKQPIDRSNHDHADTPMGDGVPLNGVEDQAARRTHMREQTMARQAAERTAVRPASERHLGLDRSGRVEAGREREATLRVELTRINAEHQTWLDDREQADSPESAPSSLLPADTMAPGGTMDRFMVILRMLQRGATLRAWAKIFAEVPNYAHVASRPQGMDLRPKRPVEFDGTVYDLEHPVRVHDDGTGTMRIVAGIETPE